MADREYRQALPKTDSSLSICGEPICTACGKTYRQYKNNFYMSSSSNLWKANGKYTTICKTCIDSMFSNFKTLFESDRLAMVAICHYLDMPFYHTLFDNIIEKNTTFAPGLYLRNMNNTQYRNKTFVTTLIDGELHTTQEESTEIRQARWSKSDKQNKEFIISTLGFDPFEDIEMTDSDRRFIFNTLNTYLDVDGIQDDGHKKQICVQISLNTLQCRKLDTLINQQLSSPKPDPTKIKNLNSSKKNLIDNINALAKDNSISSLHNGASKVGKNTLTSKMKDMDDLGFENVKVNLFDIETCESMRQIADLSNSSLLEQLNFDANEYTQIINDQREMIQVLQSNYDELNEKHRILKNEKIDLEKALTSKKKSR